MVNKSENKSTKILRTFIFNAILIYVLQEWNITQLTFEEDPEPYGKERDAAICALAAELGVQVVTKPSHTLYDLRQ